MRGTKVNDGATRIAPNGYHYTKQDGKWRLTHHIVYEKATGEKVDSTVTVRFKDSDRTNMAPDNLYAMPKKGVSKEARKRVIKQRIAELQRELDALDLLDEQS